MNQQEIEKLKDRAITNLKKYIHPDDIVIAGISGGPDSVFLLHFLKKLPIKIIVAHVNHQLRKEAGRDEVFVKNLAITTAPTASTAIDFEYLKADIKSLSKKNKQGLEETGRKIRYDFFKKLAGKYHANFIVTAHHADDNLETVISNFARGAGLQGLSGMQEKEDISVPTENSKNQNHKGQKTILLRPLLAISKQQILDYLKYKKIPFRLDKSNNSTIYRRNFIRHKVIPEFKKLNSNLAETIGRNAENLREINDYLRNSAQKWISENQLHKNRREFDAKNFRAQPEVLQKIILLEIHQLYLGNTTNIENKHLKEILALIKKNIGNKKKRFGKLSVVLKNNILTLHAKL